MRFCEYNNCQSPVFGTDKNTRKGYCKRHQFARTDLSKKSIIQRAIENHKLNSKQSSEESRKVVETHNRWALNEWFAYHMEHSQRVCENCGADLSRYNEKDWRGSQDHIIEKSEINGCPSVATVLENHCVLGKWCCHSQKHTSQLNLSRMKIFTVLKERFAKFQHLIVPDERKKIPECFLK